MPLGRGLWCSRRRVERGSRSPSSLEMYRRAVEQHVIPGVGSLRLGEITTARLDRFLQAGAAQKGYATAKLCRTVLSGICGWLVRQDALGSNPVRDCTPLEGDRDRTPRALTPVQLREWLAILDGDPEAQRRDLPELARFILATGVRLGEALGVRWSDIDLSRGVVSIERTVVRLKGKGPGRLEAQVAVVVPGAGPAGLVRDDAEGAAGAARGVRRAGVPGQQGRLPGPEQRRARLPGGPCWHRVRLGASAHVPQDGGHVAGRQGRDVLG